MTRSSSTYSLSGPIKSYSNVHRSNSVDGNSQSAMSRLLLCASRGLQGRIASSSENLSGYSLANSCPAANSDGVGDD